MYGENDPLSKQMMCSAGKDPRSKHTVEFPLSEIVINSATRYPFTLFEMRATARIVRYTHGHICWDSDKSYLTQGNVIDALYLDIFPR